ncbi:50S ribosomal protein L13 [candidate division WOR-1 bacterium RIFOXYB2_FULL_48_7]|uniref:Large ribosomal subunit protein uL13 n=1 Tax=candidate division WOR-1 bacterium RIFOXYB2_FULL_48_7 TaxID=1802583 RepID=A0A1F4TS26_UNCSA|nr:MAG: 50S ribosomal protein L13 [candidate division WOR-1 bacterium RIFOXYB2_FULL_48_7]
MKKRRTVFTRAQDVKRAWYQIDATDVILGRLATKAADYLRGKHKPLYTPNADCGDYIVVTNAAKVKVSGKKNEQKMYFTHSGYPGGEKLFSFEKMASRKPEQIIRLAVEGMLPKNKLAAHMINKLKIFKGEAPQYGKLPKLEV